MEFSFFTYMYGTLIFNIMRLMHIENFIKTLAILYCQRRHNETITLSTLII